MSILVSPNKLVLVSYIQSYIIKSTTEGTTMYKSVLIEKQRELSYELDRIDSRLDDEDDSLARYALLEEFREVHNRLEKVRLELNDYS